MIKNIALMTRDRSFTIQGCCTMVSFLMNYDKTLFSIVSLPLSISISRLWHCTFCSVVPVHSELGETQECICSAVRRTCWERSTAASYRAQTVSEIFKNTRYFKRETRSSMDPHCCQNGSQRSAVWPSVLVPARITATPRTSAHLYRFPACPPHKDVRGARQIHYRLLKEESKKLIIRYKGWMRMKRQL